MPWEVTIRRDDGGPLGELATVRQKIAAAVPAMQFRREASGPEKIAATRALGIEFPDALRQHFEQRPATEQAEFEGNGFSVVLYGFEAKPLTVIHAEVRGEGNPVPVLAALCRALQSVVVDDTTSQQVDLEAAVSGGWEAFRRYRELAIRSLQASGSGE